jgi:hypothetical protein
MKSVTHILAISVLVLMVAAIAGTARPVLADGGGAWNATDGRISPNYADRVVVYCLDDRLAVWGTDGLSQGHYLTTFSLAELTSGKAAVHDVALGTVRLNLDAMPQTHYGYTVREATAPSLITDVGTLYHIVWTGGAWGADGSAPFVKTFSCTYLPMAGQ